MHWKSCAILRCQELLSQESVLPHEKSTFPTHIRWVYTTVELAHPFGVLEQCLVMTAYLVNPFLIHLFI